jgi:hypothetical protein
MSSDNQFTALGPAVVGFRTDGTTIDLGADIAGNSIGVRATCNDNTAGVGVDGSSVAIGVHGSAVTLASTSPTLTGALGTAV